MEGIKHSTVRVNGINMHVAEAGEGPVVLLLHGFPKLWYMWRHQMRFLASHGYRAVAPDLRGYGGTDAGPVTSLHIAGDLVALLDSLGVARVLLVGHDFGAYHGWRLALFRPDRVAAYVALSVPYFPRNPAADMPETYRAILGDDFYMWRFLEAGKAEAEFARLDIATLIKTLFAVFSRPCPPLLKDTGSGWFPTTERETPPAWLTDQDVEYYAGEFSRTGFTGGLNYYRALKEDWEVTAAWTGAEVMVPSKFVVGDGDVVFGFPGVKEYINGGGMKKVVPLLEEVVIVEGATHFMNEEKPEEINAHIYDFLRKF